MTPASFVTWTGKEAQSKNKDKVKEETILTNCNVTVYHSSSNKSWTREDDKETKKDSINSRNSSSKANNSPKCDRVDTGI